ncbi:MAG: type II secretion system F family protein [Mariniblastus sp.]|nr:type II secretion system F family protein [Mariniblastus sp.]
MAEFRYKARDATGAARAGIVDANTRSAAASQLRSRGLIVIGVAPVAQPSKPGMTGIDFSNWLRPRSIDVELSLQQLAMMVKGGMPLLNSIISLIEQAPRKSLGNIWQKVVKDIQSGESLSKSMEKHSCFPDFVVQLVRVGERTGELPPVLHRAVTTMRTRRRGFQELSSALIYPLLVVCVAVGVTIYMVVYLIPRLEIYLQSLGKNMPAMTQNLVNASSWLRQYYPLIAILGCGLFVFTLVTYRSKEGRMWLDQFALRIPLIGSMFKLCETSTFARSLSVMLGSGITLIDGLGTVEKLLYNRFTAKTVNDTRTKIIQGRNFADAIDEGNAFSPMLRKMIAVGQQSGDLRGVLEEVADFHENQFQASLRRLNAILTPSLTVGVGAIVGYVYIAFFVALLAAGN